MKSSTILLTAGLLAAGCPLMELGEPPGIDSNPAVYDQILQASDPIWAEFPFDADRADAEAAFQVSSPSGRIGGRLAWRDRRAIFTPEPGLRLGTRYLFELAGTIRDSSGKCHEVHKAVPFFYGLAASALPEVRSSRPAAGGQLSSAVDPVIIDFSTAMSPAAVKDALSITPSLELLQLWSAGDTRLSLTPRTAWSDLTGYSLKIAAEAAAADGVRLAADFRLAFRVQADETPPRLLAVEAAPDDPASGYGGGGLPIETLRFRDVLRLSFSEAMDKEKTAAAVSLTPLPAGEWVWAAADRLVFVCADGWVMKKRCNLTVAESARDPAGNPLPSTFSLDFEPGIPVLELSTVEIKPSDGPPLVPDADGRAFHRLTPDAPPDLAYSFVLRFNRTFPSDQEKLAVQRAVGFAQYLAPAGAGAPFLSGFSWTNDAVLSLSYHNVAPGASGTAAYYLLTVKGGENGARNSEGSFMEGDRCLWFKAAP